METYKMFLLLCIVFMGSCGKKPKREEKEIAVINVHLLAANRYLFNELKKCDDFDPQDYDLAES